MPQPLTIFHKHVSSRCMYTLRTYIFYDIFIYVFHKFKYINKHLTCLTREMRVFLFNFLCSIISTIIFQILSIAVELNGSDVNPGICAIVKTISYRNTENISLDSEQNRYYLMKINRNSQIDGSFLY